MIERAKCPHCRVVISRWHLTNVKVRPITCIHCAAQLIAYRPWVRWAGYFSILIFWLGTASLIVRLIELDGLMFSLTFLLAVLVGLACDFAISPYYSSFTLANSERLCPACSYNLTGTTSRTCPECGNVIENSPAEPD